MSLPSSECPLQNETDDTVDDLVKSDYLHEPGYAGLAVTACTCFPECKCMMRADPK